MLIIRSAKLKDIDVIVKRSRIHGIGVYANRNFKKGEIVLKWKPKILSRAQVNKLSGKEKHYLSCAEKGKYFLVLPPERYVNHSCDANTNPKKNQDIAIKNIEKGEEITSDYAKSYLPKSFKCNCGFKRCRGLISLI